MIAAVTVLVGYAIGPARAFAQATDATIVVHAGGIRVDDTTTVAPLPDGAIFTATTPTGSVAGTCTMTAGVCNITVPSGSRYAVQETTPPGGWYLNPTLNTGSGGSVATARSYRFRTPVLTPGQTFDVPGVGANNLSTDTPFTTPTNEQTNPPAQTFSSPAVGGLATSLDNPKAPDVCGLNIAIVLDQSTSMNQPRQTAMRNAALATINALDGTPSTLSIYTYGTQANNFGSVLSQPTNTDAGITNLRNFINGLPSPAVPAGNFTNFDGGLAQVLGKGYNLVVFMTDGNPTNSRIRAATAVNTFFTDVEQGIFTANEIKDQGTRIVGVGLELGASGGEQNLRAVSGPVQNTDWFSGTNQTFEAQLREAAAGSCLNKLIIEKQIRDASGNLIVPNPTDANGWTFTTSISPGSTIDTNPPPTAASPETSVNGFTEAAVTIPATATPTVTVTESLMSGYTFVSAACTVDGSPRTTTVTGAGTASPMASFTAAPDTVLQCTFQNRRQAVTPEIKTTQTPPPTSTGQPGTVPVGGPTTDSATVTAPSSPPGLPPPTGSVVFTLYGPQTGTPPVCNSGNLKFTSNPQTVGANGVAGPATTTAPSPPGLYEWVATFTPSGANAAHFTGTASTCGAEPIEVVRAQPTITTPATAPPVTLGSGAGFGDTATLTGGAPPFTGTPPSSGTVTFRFFPPGTTDCNTTTPSDEQTVEVTGNTASTTRDFIPDRAGTWYLQAIYSGNTDNAPVASGCTAEPRVVNPATPGFSTEPSAGGVIGTPQAIVFDEATVTPAPGGPAPTGSVTFNLYGPFAAGTTPTCTTGTLVPGSTSTIPLTPPGTLTVRSTPVTLTAAGTYQWVASFTSGDNNYTNAGPTGCPDTTEQVVIGPAQPDKPITKQSPGGPLGTSITDSVEVTGGSPPLTPATVTFQLFGPQTGTTPSCTPANLVPGSTSTVGLTPGTPPTATSPSFTPTAAGLYQWVVTYNGHANNLPSTSVCGDEPVEITPTTPTVMTVTAPPSPVEVGTSLSDSVTVSGPPAPPTFPTPTGSVTFELFGPQTGATATCTDANRFFGPVEVPLTAGAATVPAPLPAPIEAGTYQWLVIYSPNGDTNYLAGDSGCGNEPVTVNKATPAISTSQTPAPTSTGPGSVPVGGPIADSATVSAAPGSAPGLGIPTGTVTFSLFGPFAAGETPSCTTGNLKLASGPITLDGGTASFSADAPSPPGTYFWQVTYDPEDNPTFGPVTSGCADEPIIVTKAKPVIETEPVVANPAGEPVGSAIGDIAAIVSGGFNPTGTVSFELFGPGDTECAGNLVADNPAFQNIPLENGRATAPTFPTTEVGTYRWVAIYNGDTNNQSVNSGCEAEPVIIVKATPDVATLQSDDGPVGTVMSDVATVTGGFNPSGTVTFQLFAPGDTLCQNPIATFENVPLSGSPLTAASGPVTSTEVGIHRWLVTYNGDDFNMVNSSGCQEEELVITEAPPTPTPSPGAPLPEVPGLPSTGWGGVAAAGHAAQRGASQ